MPEESFEEKSEEPTPKKLREAREKGSVARSMELNSAVILLASASFLYFTGSVLAGKLASGMKMTFLHIGKVEALQDQVAVFYMIGLKHFFEVAGPFLLFILVLGIGVNVLQVGFLFTGQPLEPDLSKISPLKGAKNIVSLRGLTEALKGLFKVLLVFIVSYWIIIHDLGKILSSTDCTTGQIAAFMGWEMYKLALVASAILLAMAGLDYAFQRWNYMKSMRMTKQEVKEERKQMEGDPMVKARIKSLQREMARRRMMDEVPKATVVVTNPTFIAVAIQYEAGKMSAPKVVAKGKRLIAQRIRELARQHGIPIVEDKPLARSLFDTVQPGDEIPSSLFAAVAEVLAYVYRLQNKKAA